MFFSLSFSTIMHTLTFHNDYAHVSFALKKAQISGPYFFDYPKLDEVLTYSKIT